jgi:hypothetical protein
MKATELASLKLRIVRVCRMHFYIALALAVQIMVYDAWKLIQPQAVLERWLAVAVLFIGATAAWLLARSPSKKALFYKRIIAALVIIDVLAASALVYQTRGMASRAVLLYVIPIAVAGILRSRVALVGAAFLSVAAYTTTAVAYFVINFNEGYKVELYGEVGFYSAFLVLFSLTIWALLNPAKKE